MTLRVVLLAAEAAEEAQERVGTLVEDLAGIDWGVVITRVVGAALVLLAAFLLARLARRSVRRWVSRATARGLARAGDDGRRLRAELRAKTLGDVMADAARALIWTLALLIALTLLAVPVGPLVASAGIAGVALGFGAQSLVKDFFSGFFILLEDQYGIGDVIWVSPDVNGLVEDVTLRVTRLRSLDGTVWFVPNGEIRFLGNRSKEWSRALVDFQVAYGEDVEEVMATIREVAAELRSDEELGPKILEDVEILGVEQLAESGVTIRTFIKTVPLEQWAVSRRFRQGVKAAFDARGIEIPFPHRKIVVSDGDTPAVPRRARKQVAGKGGA